MCAIEQLLRGFVTMLHAGVVGTDIGHVAVFIPLYRQLPLSRQGTNQYTNGGRNHEQES